MDERTGQPRAAGGHRAWGALWAAVLAGSILTSHRLPGVWGLVPLTLLAGGFALFLVAWQAAPADGARLGFAASRLSRPLQAVYWSGYALMVGGSVLAALAWLVGTG